MKRRRFIIYFRYNLNNELTEAVGSDGIRSFDNRMSNSTIINNILQQDNTFDKKKGYIGFKIVIGTISNYREMTNLYKL